MLWFCKGEIPGLPGLQILYMRFLRDPDFAVGFITGFFVHTAMVWKRTNFFPFPIKCAGNDCSNIYYWDMPASILYYAFDGARLVFASFLIGGIYWGFIFYGLLLLCKRFFGNDAARR